MKEPFNSTKNYFFLVDLPMLCIWKTYVLYHRGQMYHTVEYLLVAGLETPAAEGYSFPQLNQVCHLNVKILALQNQLRDF